MTTKLFTKEHEDVLIEAYQAHLEHDAHPAFQFTYVAVTRGYEDLEDLMVYEFDTFVQEIRSNYRCVSCGQNSLGSLHCEECYNQLQEEN